MKKLIVLSRLTAFILQGYFKRILAPDRNPIRAYRLYQC